jgi:hypothetical protein
MPLRERQDALPWPAAEWKLASWERTHGRMPTPDDFITPSLNMTERSTRLGTPGVLKALPSGRNMSIVTRHIERSPA